MPQNPIQQLTEALVAFRDDRDWKQFHNPKDLATALSIEASELQEIFLWKNGPAYTGSFTIKVYTSEKVATDEGWQHQRIILQPRSNQPEFDAIYFHASTAQHLSVLGEFVTTL